MAHKSDKPEFNDSDEVPVNAAAENDVPSPLEDQIRKLTAEKDELRDTLLRRQADFENYRKRMEKERHQERHRGVEHVVEALLPVLDAFDNALASAEKDSAAAEYVTGFELIRRQLWDLLSKQGLTRIESVGKEFNPHFHHAIARVETSEQPEDTVVGELQPGYTFHERVLRPAMVRVATEPAHSKRDN
ncbi:MAG TPA: nucleotide exchange factor GrpE [Candidatus Acidoferrales bacterium]|nr:nucleotide exchange factor GrpE [Candidatus Acidoferrales bacterium]